MIQAIYREEKQLKDLPTEERRDRHQWNVRPLLEAYFAWIKENRPKVPQKRKTWESFQCSIHQKRYLKVFLDDGSQNSSFFIINKMIFLPTPLRTGIQSSFNIQIHYLNFISSIHIFLYLNVKIAIRYQHIPHVLKMGIKLYMIIFTANSHHTK